MTKLKFALSALLVSVFSFAAIAQENIDYYFFTSDTENFVMFKADGDQDRKNLG